MNRHALIVTTISGFIKSFEMNDISILQEMGYTVHIATNIAEEDKSFFQQRDLVLHQIEFERFPFKSNNFKAIKKIQRIIEDNNILLVHCHTPVGGVIARLAAKKYKKYGCRVIYTVHGLQFCKGSPKKDWMIYYPVEKFLSKNADAIITINSEDYRLVSKKFHSKKAYYLPGVGVDLTKFNNDKADAYAKRKEMGLNDNDIVLLSVGELNVRKNHQIIIDAFSKINKDNMVYLIAGDGPLKEQLQQQIYNMGLEKRVILLGYRTDINEILKCVDVFVLPSKREGLSVALMESMASGLPVVCSNIRGNADLIDNNCGGFLCGVNDVDSYAQALTQLVEDASLRNKMSEYNKKKIQDFSLDVIDKKMRSIYREIVD